MKGTSVMKKCASILLAALIALMPLMRADFGTVRSAAEELPVVFIKDGGTGDGTSAENAMAATTDYVAEAANSKNHVKDSAMYKAWAKLRAAGGGTIVICGPYTISNDMCEKISENFYDFKMDYTTQKRNITITYTSVYGGVDYRTTNDAALILAEKAQLTFPTATVTENLTVKSTGGTEKYIAAGTCALTLGQGTNFVPNGTAYPTVVGGWRTTSGLVASYSNGDTNVTVDIGEGNRIGDVYGANNGANKTQVGNTTVTIKSGTIGTVGGDGRLSGQGPLNGTVTMNLEGGVYTGKIIASNVGFSSDCTTKTALVKVTGGDYTNCTGLFANVDATNQKPTEVVLDASEMEDMAAFAKIKAILNGTFTTIEPDPTTKKIVFVGNNEVSEGSGETADDPLKADAVEETVEETDMARVEATALYKAWTILREAGGGTIVFTDEYVITKEMAKRFTATASAYDFTMGPAAKMDTVPIKYTSVFGGVDYRETKEAKLVLESGVHLTFPTETITENLTVEVKGAEHYIAAGTSDLTLGEGTNFVPNGTVYPTVLGSWRTTDTFAASLTDGDTHITIDLGEDNAIGDVFGAGNISSNKAHTGNVVIDLKSGTVRNLYGDSRNGGNSTKQRLNGTVTINIEGGKVLGKVAGSYSGFDAAATDKTVLYYVTGGDFSSAAGFLYADENVAADAQATSVTLDLRDADAETAVAAAGLAAENVTVLLPEGVDVDGDPKVIFIADGGTGNGSSAAKALGNGSDYQGEADTSANRPKDAAIYKAWEQLMALGGGTIVICGPYTLNNAVAKRAGASSSYYDVMMDASLRKPDVKITYTSVYNGVDYRETNGAKITLAEGASMAFPTETATENITFEVKNSTDKFIAAGVNPLTLGQGTSFTGTALPQILGGYRAANVIGKQYVEGDISITVDIGDENTVGDIYALHNGGASGYGYTGDITFNFKSGTFSKIFGDSKTANTGKPIGDITMNISGGVYKDAITANNTGFFTEGHKVLMNVTGGDFSACPAVRYASGDSVSIQAESVTADLLKAPASVLSVFPTIAEERITLLLPENMPDPTVIFIRDGGTGDGSNADNALKPTTGNYDETAANPEKQKDAALYQAIEKLMALGGGTIVICGPYTLNDSNCQPIGASSADFIFAKNLFKPDVTITFTSVYDGVDYRETNGAEIILDERAHLTFATATVLENVTLRAAGSIPAHYVAGGTNPLTLGNGTNFVPNGTNYPILVGGFRANSGKITTGDIEFTVDIGEGNAIGDVYLIGNGGVPHTGNVTLNVKSGSIGSVYGDAAATNQIALDGDITMNLSGGAFRGFIFGNNVGFTGECEKKLSINITGGDFSECQGIKSATSYVNTYSPAATAVADARTLDNSTASKLKAITDPSVTLLLPEDFKDEAGSMVIFIRDGATGDGTSAESPLKPTTGNFTESGNNPERQKDSALYQAMVKLLQNGGGTIVFCGPYTLNDSNCQPIGASSADFILPTDLYRKDLTIKYTSVYDGVDYRKTAGAKLILAERAHLTFPSGTVLENLTVQQVGDVATHYIAGGTNPLTLASGTNFIPNGNNYPAILGAFRSNGGRLKKGDVEITVDIGNGNAIGSIYGLCNGGSGPHVGNVTINVKSGRVGSIYGDSAAKDQVKIDGDITMNLSGGTYQGYIIGTNIGFGGSAAKKVQINVTGGYYADCTRMQSASATATGGVASPAIADCRKASVKVARQVKRVADSSVKVLLPAGFTDEEYVIFISDNGTGDGTSADKPLKPTTGNYDTKQEYPQRYRDSSLYQAMEKLMKAGGGTIVVCGRYTLDETNCQPIGSLSSDFIMLPVSLHQPEVTITYTSVYGGVDYREKNDAEIVLDGKSHLTFPSGTVLKDITIRSAGDITTHFVCGGMNPLTLGQGTNFIPSDEKVEAYPTVLGGYRSNANRKNDCDVHITVDIGDENRIGAVYGLNNGGNGRHTGNVTIDVKSGQIGGLYGDSRAIGEVAIDGKVNYNISGGVFRGIIAGVNVGFAGECAREVEMKITGGDFTDCVGIMGTSMTATLGVSRSCIVDATETDLETARRLKAICYRDVTLLLPEDYTDPTEPETEEESTEEPHPETESEEESTEAVEPIPVGNNVNGGLIAAIAGGSALLIGAAVAIILILKKRKKS